MQQPVQLQHAAECNGSRGGGPRPRPARQAKVVYFHLALLDGARRSRSSSEVRARALHPPLRVRSDPTTPHAGLIRRL